MHRQHLLAKAIRNSYYWACSVLGWNCRCSTFEVLCLIPNTEEEGDKGGRESEVGKKGEERGGNREERSSYYLSGACYLLGYLVPGNLVFCFLPIVCF